MTGSQTAPRSLTQMLRDSTDDALCDLLLSRPDLAEPRPTSYSQVASRATTRESVRRALDERTALELWVAQQAVAATPPVGPQSVAGLPPEQAAAVLERLRKLALLWGEPGALRPVRALAIELESHPISDPPEPLPPAFPGAVRRPPAQVDHVAAGSAFELVRRVEVLVEHSEHTPVRLRRDGGFAQRESRGLATLLDLPVAESTFHVEVALAAALLGPAPGGRDDVLIPTVAFDDWQGWSLAEQWAAVTRGWRDRHAASGSAGLKQRCFSAFGPASEGLVLGIAELRRWLAWHLPRRLDEAVRRAATMLAQAAWIGATGLGARSSFGLGEDPERLEHLLPERGDTVVVQNDLTAIAPAPLTPQAARDLGALADVESRGGATVYRFSVESLRRAHAMGWSTAEITAVLHDRSRTPLPQPLTYLVADLDRLSGHPNGAVMPADREGASGPWRSPANHRRPPRAAPPALRSDARPPIDADAAAQLARELRRAAESDVPDEPGDPGGSGTDQRPGAEARWDSPLGTLSEAVETGELVWIGYVDALGASGERLVYASSVEEGSLVARDSRSSAEVVLPVHRIRSAHIIRGASV